MCLKIQTPWPMPEETGRIGKRILEEHDPYRLIGDRLFEKWREEEFADLYSREGKTGLLARDPGLCEYLSVHGKISRSASSASAAYAPGLEVCVAPATGGSRF